MNQYLFTIVLSVFIVSAVVGNRVVSREKDHVVQPGPDVNEEVLSAQSGEGVTPTPSVKPFPTLITITPSKQTSTSSADIK
ncbi:MAG: hypothetical protein US95_C0046G0011 [Candidatus Woesebacteria bacterium GW2011_GWB1_38_5]|uniref:Uncharacterized protein n=2 Tax=Candidatus Woeseibacteriota TaxID=1752722 RepID=A0A0G0MJ81_9BACT|nr:MAG: hypothetical protein US75_C0023G0005 [Candidatus Woesebacteria bacterium GW2011_GWC1_38_13]KKQ73789.1 MAG: hypothetical protein US95_C0046G0011 [Candidatus Woesebacteria bacterium GW2011_GWB1_38_5]